MSVPIFTGSGTTTIPPGSGINNRLAKYNGTSTITSSNVLEDGTTLNVRGLIVAGNTTPSGTLTLRGTTDATTGPVIVNDLGGGMIVGATAFTSVPNIGEYQRNTDGTVCLEVVNPNDGANVDDRVAVRVGTTTVRSGFMFARSAAYVGGLPAVAGEFGISTGNASRFLINTQIASPIEFETTNLVRYRIQGGGNLEMVGNLDFIPSADNAGEIGTDTLRFNNVRSVNSAFDRLGVTNQTVTTTSTLTASSPAVVKVSGAITVTLPTAVNSDRRFFWFKKTDAGTTTTIDGNGVETIDGLASIALANQHDAETLYCDGTEWFRL